MRLISLIFVAALLFACGPPAVKTVPRLTLAQMPCGEHVPTCQRLKDGGVGCCARSPGTEYRWECRDEARYRDRDAFEPVPELMGVRQLASGSYATCGLFDDGAVRCWGMSGNGALGRGAYRVRPGVLARASRELLHDTPRTTSVAGRDGDMTCATLLNGDMTCTPADQPLQDLTGCRRRSPGTIATVCDELHDVETWCPWIEAPLEVSGLRDPVQISGGHRFFCAVEASGELLCWGENDDGRLGVPAREGLPVPTTVDVGAPVVKVELGPTGGCALTVAGDVMCWDQVAQASLTASTAGPVVDMVRAGGRSCVRLSGGGVRCQGWGWPEMARPGDSHGQPVVLLLPELDAATHISLSQHQGCAVQRGEVWCWGVGPAEAPTTADAARRARRVEGLEGVTEVVGMLRAQCALNAEGWQCWGEMPWGETWERPTPLGVEAERLALLGNGVCGLTEGEAPRCRGRALDFATDRVPIPRPEPQPVLAGLTVDATGTPPELVCHEEARFRLGEDQSWFPQLEPCIDAWARARSGSRCHRETTLVANEGGWDLCTCDPDAEVCRAGVTECASRSELEAYCEGHLEPAPALTASLDRWCVEGQTCIKPPERRPVDPDGYQQTRSRPCQQSSPRRFCFQERAACQTTQNALTTVTDRCAKLSHPPLGPHPPAPSP